MNSVIPRSISFSKLLGSVVTLIILVQSSNQCLSFRSKDLALSEHRDGISPISRNEALVSPISRHETLVAVPRFRPTTPP